VWVRSERWTAADLQAFHRLNNKKQPKPPPPPPPPPAEANTTDAGGAPTAGNASGAEAAQNGTLPEQEEQFTHEELRR
jgi:hypoxia up-regulated 1